MKKSLILIVLIVLLIILLVGWLSWRGYQLKKEGTTITTYKKEYSIEENPKIKIENNLPKNICFSSCYPYYLERNNGGFKSYRYGSCPEADITEICINPGKIKAFELILDKMRLEKGLHRVAIPACIGCTLLENFRKDKWFYSNEFIVK